MLRPNRADFRRLLRLALPLVAIQVGLMFMGVVDTAMVGRVSADALAAVAIANVYFFVLITVGMGCLYALDPVVSQAFGAGDRVAVVRSFQRGFLIAAIVTVPTSIALIPIEPVLRWSGQPAATIPLAGRYLDLILPGVFPFFAFIAVRQTLQALGKVRHLVLTILAANGLNALLNWVFIYGHFGAPALGVAGSAIATTVSRWAMLIGVLAATWRTIGPMLRPWHRESWAWAPLERMFRIGLPIGFQILFEYGVFGLVGFLLGRLGSDTLAAHQIALNLASVTFMVPYGVAGAAAVLVGHAVGAGQPEPARRIAVAAIVVGGGFMALTALTFITLPALLAQAYSSAPAVIGLAVTLIPVAGAFQVFDGIQAVSFGVLRGVGDTRIPVVINVVGYYVIGLPLGLWLGYRTSLGPRGFWWGLVIGLAAVACTMVLRVRYRMGQRLGRIRVESTSVPPLDDPTTATAPSLPSPSESA